MLVARRSPTVRAPRLVLLALTLALALPAGAAAAEPGTRLVPIGSGYTETTLQQFAAEAVEVDTSGNVLILVLPITFGLDAFESGKRERRENLELAETRTSQVEAACEAVRAPEQTCDAVLVPVLVRDDALDPANAAFFTPDVDGIYILGGDQTVAMRVVADTPIEEQMANAYERGVVVGGNSAGAAVQSLNMIAGYVGNNGPENGLQQGAVDIWTSEGVGDHERGLIFGLDDVLLDQHVYQRGRIGRLINASLTTGLLGLGVDADTGVVIHDEARVVDVRGSTSAIAVDVDTFGATGAFAGPTNSLSFRGVATSLVAPADGYDLDARTPIVGGIAVPAPDLTGRTYPSFGAPAGSGTLLLGGGQDPDGPGAVGERFVTLAGGTGADLVVLATGYAKPADGRAHARAWAQSLEAAGTEVEWFLLDTRTDVAAVQAAVVAADGVILAAPDQSTVLDAFAAADPIVDTVRAAWLAGTPVLADDAAGAAVGAYLSTDPTPPDTASGLESASIGDFTVDGVTIEPGLGWLDVSVEPRLLTDRHWGRLYHHGWQHPETLAAGVDVATALEVTGAGAAVVGDSAAVVFDARYATYDVAANDALAARWVILDSFVDGEPVAP